MRCWKCLLVIVGLAACSSSGPDVVPPDPTIATESVVVTSAPTTVAAPPTATFSPAVTDPVEIQAILDELDRKEGDMFRAFVAARAVTPEVERLADEVFNFAARAGIERGLRQAASGGLAGYAKKTGNPLKTLVKVLESDRGCLVVRVREDLVAVNNVPLTENVLVLGRLFLNGVEENWKVAATLRVDHPILKGKSCLP